MNTQNDARAASPARLHRRALLGGIAALLGGVLLAASSGQTGAQMPDPSPPVMRGPTISSSDNVPTNGPLSALVAAPAPATSPPVYGLLAITQADNGTTVNLPAGMQVLLALDGNDDWTVTVDDQTILTPVVGAVAPSGTQGVYAASQPGQTTLAAIGEPPCRKAQPACLAPTLLFRVQIVVA